MLRFLKSPRLYFALAGVLGVWWLVTHVELRPAVTTVPTGERLRALAERGDVNVVFILIDTLRSDRLGSYGHERPTSPFLDTLAQRGVRFARTTSPSSWTKPAMASIFTSTYAAAHGVLRAEDALPSSATLPAEIFRAAGYRTAAILSNWWVTRKFGFDQGYETFLEFKPDWYLKRGAGEGGPADAARIDRELTAAAVEFVRLHRDERFFLYLHYMGVHNFDLAPAPPKFGDEPSDRYDNAVAMVDEEIRSFVRTLREEGLVPKTLLVITSDHGESLEEHGVRGHGRTLYRQEIDVPFILVPPFRMEPALEVRALTNTIDVFPTVLELVGLEPIPGARGRSLVPLIQAGLAGAELPAELVGRSTYAHLDRTWHQPERAPRPIAAVITRRFRLLQDLEERSAAELYDGLRDPAEEYNLAADRPRALASLQRKAFESTEGTSTVFGRAPDVELDDTTRQMLRGLGYALN